MTRVLASGCWPVRAERTASMNLRPAGARLDAEPEPPRRPSGTGPWPARDPDGWAARRSSPRDRGWGLQEAATRAAFLRMRPARRAGSSLRSRRSSWREHRAGVPEQRCAPDQKPGRAGRLPGRSVVEPHAVVRRDRARSSREAAAAPSLSRPSPPRPRRWPCCPPTSLVREYTRSPPRSNGLKSGGGDTVLPPRRDARGVGHCGEGGRSSTCSAGCRDSVNTSGCSRRWPGPRFSE
jgi:hypothetical protein